MAREIRDVVMRSRDTIITDVLGMAALVVILFGALSLPTLV